MDITRKHHFQNSSPPVGSIFYEFFMQSTERNTMNTPIEKIDCRGVRIEILPDRITAIDRSDGLATGELDLEAIEDRICKHIWGENSGG